MKIVTKLRPFSHYPGISAVVPGTTLVFQAFPTLFRIDGKDYKLALRGPVKDFTLTQDLERHALFVTGEAKEGYFRFQIIGSEKGIHVKCEKGDLLSFDYLKQTVFYPKLEKEKLSLGSHKAMNWEIISKEPDLKAVIPVLFSLGQNTPKCILESWIGTARLLNFPTSKNELEPALKSFFKACFSNILVPRLFDDQFQGLSEDEISDGNPFFLLSEGFRKIRDLFFQSSENKLTILPHLAKCFDSGKMLGCNAEGIGIIDFEWSKFLLRKMVIYPTDSKEIFLDLQSQIKKFRVQKKDVFSSTHPISIEKGKALILDHFQK